MDEDKYIEHLQSRIKNLEDCQLNTPCVPNWVLFRKKFIKNVFEGDISNFCNWGLGMNYTLPSFEPFRYIRNETSDWPRWLEAMKESPLGNPGTSLFYPETSENTIHQARHIAGLVRTTSCNVEELEEIIEFGGGYGCLCRFLFRLGFKGRYVMYDFPEILALQEYYLSQIDIEPKPKLFYNQTTDESNCIVFLDNLKLLEEQVQINKKQDDLFIATWSISEVDPRRREKIFNVLNPMKYYLFAFAGNWKGRKGKGFFTTFDNKKYFEIFKLERDDYIWCSYPIDYHRGDHLYIVGEQGAGTLTKKQRRQNAGRLETLKQGYNQMLLKKEKAQEAHFKARKIRDAETKERKRKKAEIKEKRRKKRQELREKNELILKIKQEKIQAKQEELERRSCLKQERIQRKLSSKQQRYKRQGKQKKGKG